MKRAPGARQRGYSLIGIASAIAWSPWTILTSPGRPGREALQMEQATELLVQAQQEALVLAFSDLAAEVGEEFRPIPSRVAGISLWRQVERSQPGLLRMSFEARWNQRRRDRRLVLVAIRAEHSAGAR